MTENNAIAQKLLQIQAIKLNPEEPFTWASGWKSPIYCDNRKALSFPYIREFIKSELCNVVFTEFDDADIVAGVATAGVPWGAMVADQLKLPFVYVRSKPKEHGMGNQIEGAFEAGKKVVLIEDLVSTGKSSLEAAEALKSNGMVIEGMVSILNYGFEVAKTAFENAGIRVISLTDYSALIHLAKAQGIVNAEEENALLKWRDNPSEWGKFV